LIPDLEQFEVGTVIAKGVIAAIGGELQIEIPNFDYPADEGSSRTRLQQSTSRLKWMSSRVN
jgi:hypothetical protein